MNAAAGVTAASSPIVWWDATGTRRGRVLAYGLACQPAPIVASNRTIDAAGFGRPVHALLTGEPARLWGLAPSLRR